MKAQESEAPKGTLMTGLAAVDIELLKRLARLDRASKDLLLSISKARA